MPDVEVCDWLNAFSNREFTVGVTCIVDGLRGLVVALASDGTSLSEACLELIVVGPRAVDLVVPFVWS